MTSRSSARLVEVLASMPVGQIGSVTGPGRSGAVAAVYAGSEGDATELLLPSVS